MVPKRKLILKRKRMTKVHQSRPKETEITQVDLIDSLQSEATRSGMLSVLANLSFLPSQINRLVLIDKLVQIAHSLDHSVINLALHAIANLCQVEQSLTTVIFERGLDKALIKINPNEMKLLEPVLLLMLAAYNNLPAQHHYLVHGLHSVLGLKHLASDCGQLAIQFLIRTGCSVVSTEVTMFLLERLNSNIHMRFKSLCLGLLMSDISANPHKITELTGHVAQFIGTVLNSIDLEFQYRSNIKPVEDAMENDNEQPPEEQNQAQASNHTEDLWTDSLETVQLTLEFIHDHLLSNQWVQEESPQVQSPEDPIKGVLLNILTSNSAGLFKNVALTFPVGENIVELALKLIETAQLVQNQKHVQIVLGAIKLTLSEKDDRAGTLPQVLASGLAIILNKFPSAISPQELLMIAQLPLPIIQEYQRCWMVVLELISKSFNAQNPQIVPEINFRCGLILKALLERIPHQQLEEWRAQVIDTIFDVYSNERFDQSLAQLGLLPVLQQLAAGSQGSKKSKFLKEVLQDIRRFLEYKQKMMSV